jgi:hypothetical protein
MSVLAFVIWLIGWPLSNQLQLAYSKSCGIEYSDQVRTVAAIFNLAVWILVAVMLWKKVDP